MKPLKQLTEVQHKQRKLAEGSVDKTARGLSDWRAAEAKSKKQSHQCARDNEKLQDALLDVRYEVYGKSEQCVLLTDYVDLIVTD